MSSNFRPAPLKAKWRYLRNQMGFRQSPLRVIFRLLSWRIRCLLGIPATIKLPRWDVRLFLPAEWRGFSKLAFTFRENYEPELAYLERLISPGSVVVDAGANCGIYTVAASKLVGDHGIVLAFEPAVSTFRILEYNVQLNGLRNVHAFRVALWDREGKAHLYHHPDPGRDSLGRDVEMKGGVEEISTVTLDKLLDRESIDSVDFIKMDVEGAEEMILRGASSLLHRARPVVVFEINPGVCTRLGFSKDGAWNLLKGLGYRFFSMENNGDLQKLSSLPNGGNVVAIHGKAE